MSEASSSESDGIENQSPGFLMKCSIKAIGLKFQSVKNISTNCLASWLAGSENRAVALLDCRTENEFIISHIEGAIDAAHQTKSAEELVAKCDEKLNGKANPTIVCYCSVGYRSSDTAQILSKFYDQSGKQPRPEIYNLEGSLFKWAEEKRPMINQNDQSTPFVHPYNTTFGKLVSKHLRKEKL